MNTDVLIVGGGLAGVLTAFMLHKAGVQYALIEKDEICCGITTGTTAKITSQHGLIYGKLLGVYGAQYARMYWQVNEQALERYRSLCRDISCDFEEKSNFIYSTDNPDAIFKEIKALERLDIPATHTTKTELPFSVAGAVEFKNQAQFNPLKFVAEISKGLNIYEHTKALEFKGNTVITNCGIIKANRIVITTHFPIINKRGGYFIKMHQNRSYVIALENAEKYEGMYLDEAEDGLSFRNYENLLLLGGGSHKTGELSDGWRSLEDFAKKNYPNAEIKYKWAAQDCITLDDSAYIGKYSKGSQNLYTATGFNKWGMTLSMVSAMVLCDILTGKENKYIGVFDPSRKILHPQLFCNMGTSAKNIFTFSTPRCPHLGCALKWNKYENSWDCPCHGSRFSQDGRLLDNPATDDMKI